MRFGPIAFALLSLAACKKTENKAPAISDAAAASASGGSVTIEPSRYAVAGEWGKGDVVWVQTTNAVFSLDPKTGVAQLVATFEADIRRFDAAEDGDAFVVLLRSGDAYFGTSAGAPRVVPLSGAYMVEISKTGSCLVVANHQRGSYPDTEFLDAPSLEPRGRITSSASFVDRAGEIAMSDMEIFETRGGKSLLTIDGEYRMMHSFETRVAAFTESELIVFDVDKRSTVRVPASCARRKDEPALGTDAFHDRSKRAVRYCRDHVLVFDVGTLARTSIEIPNPPPRTQEGGFPWFGSQDLSFAKESDAVVFRGSGYEHELILAIDAKKKSVRKLKELPTLDDGLPTRGDLTLHWGGGTLKVKDASGNERASFGDPRGRRPAGPRKPIAKPSSDASDR